MKAPHNLRTAAGFSLTEIMVAVVVICVGLLGIAKLQALSLSNTNISRQRSIAAMQAASLASAMHSNRQYWGSVAAFNVNIQGAGVVTSSDAALNGINLAGSVGLCNVAAQFNGAKCTATNLAAFDLARWWQNSIVPVLPNPNVTVTCPGAAGNPAPVSCTILIRWSEKAVSMNASQLASEAASEAAAAANNPNGVNRFERPDFTLYVEP